MAQAITSITMVDEDDFATDEETRPVTTNGSPPMTPQQIVAALVRLDPEDVNDVQRELNRVWGAEGTHGE